MKSTMWTELQAIDCSIKCIDDHYGSIASIQIKHSELPRSLWFVKSQAGNWYWRKTNHSDDSYADGYIIRGKFDPATIASAPRRVYPK